MDKLISIIIPTKNSAGHLKNLLPSLVKQTYKRFELIINDDKKTKDYTQTLLKSFQEKLNITILKQNISMAQGRKSGADFAKGYYLLHLDSDMVLSPKVLQNCIETIEKGYDALLIPEVSFGEGYWSQVKVFEKSMHIGDDTIESVRFFKASVYRSVGGHNEKMVFSEDKDLDLRVRRAGYKIGRSTEPIYHNEGKVRLFKDMQKKYFYGKTAYVFIKQHFMQALIQGNLIFRPAYFRNWRKLVRHPMLSTGMFLIKTLGWLAALIGFLVERSSKLWGFITTIQVIFTEKAIESLRDYRPMKQRKVEKGLVSIIIPVLNASRHLKKLLPSLEKQTYKNIEVIINDDINTNDDTRNVVNRFKKVFRMVYLRKNISMAQGRRSAAEKAKGEYLLHVDADMVLSPNVLQACVDNVEKGFDAIVIPEISFGEGFWSRVKIFERSMYIGDDTIESVRFFKASVYRSVGGHNEKMVLSEDKDLDLRVRKSGFHIGRISEPIYHNEGNFSIFKNFRKRFFYGRTASILMLTNPAYTLKYGNIVFRPAFFRNWRRLLSHPILASCVFLMKSLDLIAGLLGMFTSRIPFIKEDIKIGIWK